MGTTGINRNKAVSFGEFVSMMQERLKARYPGCTVRTVPVDKNNGVHLTGILIMQEGQNAAPNIYMEDFYREYLSGRRIEDITNGAARLYEKNRIQGSLALPDMAHFEAVKDILCLRIVNREGSRGMLESMPHRAFLDLAVIYYIPVTLEGYGLSGRMAVTDSLLRMWGADEEALYRHALENTRRMLPVEIRTLESVMDEILSDGAGLSGQAGGEPEIPLYILRCGKGEQATDAALLYEDVLRGFAEKHGNFYILPSSVSEVMLLPVDSCPEDSAYYRSVVREVNRSQIAPEDVLSDNVYYYHADTGKIEIFS